jgi:hypothetical protein
MLGDINDEPKAATTQILQSPSGSELIDHIFVSRALLQTVEAVSTVAPGPLPSITDDAKARHNATVSDHAKITARSTSPKDRGPSLVSSGPYLWDA